MITGLGIGGEYAAVNSLCDIERDGSAKSHKKLVIENLTERGFVVSCEEPLARLKLTFRAQQLLSKRGRIK